MRPSDREPPAGLLHIDGSYGEGGGQLLRTAVALAAIRGAPVRIRSIRLRRTPPGLAPQHLKAIQAVCELSGGHLEGAALRSQEVSFAPGRMQGGQFTFDIGTAGSITLLLQALLPVMLAAQKDFCVTAIGGTDIRAAPPLDYLCNVLAPLLARMGAEVTIEPRRRGYFPRGGGVVEVSVRACQLGALTVDDPGALVEIAGIAHVAHLPVEIAGRMRSAALSALGSLNAPTRCELASIEGALAIGRGGAIVLWGRRERSVLGAGRVAQLGVRAETLGDEVGAELRADLKANTALDVHAADQILVYLALASAPSSFTTRLLSEHARTAIWLIEQFIPVRFTAESEADHVRIVTRREDKA